MASRHQNEAVMPHRALLSSEQRIRLFAIPVDPAEMVRHYVLGTQDQALVRAKRRASNRLGFAIQLCVLRYPGRAVDPTESLPASMLSFVASQIGIDPLLYGDYARRAETRREHLLELQKLLRLRSFSLPDWRACLQVGADAAWATDRGEPIVQAMLAHLRTTNVLLPAAAVLERIGLAARVRARRKVFEALADGLTDAERAALESLLTVDPEMRRSGPGTLQHHRFARPARIRTRPWHPFRARGTNSCRPPQSIGRRECDHDRTAHRRSRTHAADRHPRGPNL
jgi:hypothetical protein